MSQAQIDSPRFPLSWFSVARVLILAQTLASVIIAALNLPAAYQNLRIFTPGLGFQGWSGAQLQSAVAASGVAPGVLASLLFAASLICLLSFLGVAALLAFRKSDTWIGLMIIYILASTAPGFSFLGSNVGESVTGYFAIYRQISVDLAYPSFFVLLYLFPDGRLNPRWTHWLAPLPYLAFLLDLWIGPKNTITSLLGWFLIFYAVGGMVSQVYRYRRVSVPTQRQQTKWVVYALGILVVSIVATQAFPLLDPGLRIGTLSRFWFDLLGNYLFSAILATLIPLSIGISILRYRLWDIDLIIRRTLLYAGLSGSLGLVYFGSVVLLRQVLGGLTGNSSAALVLSTLLIAALANPLRRQVQAFIDRRFYRRKYDAGLALQDFTASARREVELAHLIADMVAVVQKTVQPEKVSVWIRVMYDHPMEKK